MTNVTETQDLNTEEVTDFGLDDEDSDGPESKRRRLAEEIDDFFRRWSAEGLRLPSDTEGVQDQVQQHQTSSVGQQQQQHRVLTSNSELQPQASNSGSGGQQALNTSGSQQQTSSRGSSLQPTTRRLVITLNRCPVEVESPPTPVPLPEPSNNAGPTYSPSNASGEARSNHPPPRNVSQPNTQPNRSNGPPRRRENVIFIADDGTEVIDDLSSHSSDEDLPISPPRPRWMGRRGAVFEPRAAGNNSAQQAVEEDDDDVFQDQHEVASDHDVNDNPIESQSSSSSEPDGDGDDLNSTRPIVDGNVSSSGSGRPQRGDASENNFADVEEDTTKECHSNFFRINAQGIRYCRECSRVVANPFFKFCDRCFKLRRDWLPVRPRSRRLKKRKKAERKQGSSLDTSRSNAGSPPDVSSMDGDTEVQHSPNTSSRTLIDFEPQPYTQPELDGGESGNALQLKSVTTGDGPPVSGGVDLHPLPMNIKDSQTQTESPAPWKPLQVSLKSTCLFCNDRENNAAFVHNKTAHLVSCYPCADKILKKSGKCPICRARVLRVVKIINVQD